MFEDRLTSDADHTWFLAQQATLVKARFGVEYGTVVTTPRLIYGDFMVPGVLGVRAPQLRSALTCLMHDVGTWAVIWAVFGTLSAAWGCPGYLQALTYITKPVN